MTAQPTTKCDPDIYENGHSVAVLAGCSTAIEALVVRVREKLNVPLDWHYCGGRADILTTAPREKDEEIRDALKMAMPIWLAGDPAERRSPHDSTEKGK